MARRPPAPREESPLLLFDFCVEGIARSARSKRRVQLRAWQKKVAAQAKATIAQAPLVEGPVDLHLTEFSEARTKDRDNFAKPILDALENVIFRNDAQVLRLEIDGAISTVFIECVSCRKSWQQPWSRGTNLYGFACIATVHEGR